MVLSVAPGTSVLLTPEGGIDPEVYAPASLTLRPFVVGRTPRGEAVLCVDPKSTAFSQTHGDPLFVNAQPSAIVAEARERVAVMAAAMDRTRGFVDTLRRHDLLAVYSAGVARGPAGHSAPIAEYVGVSRERLASAPISVIEALHAGGMLSAVYSQLLSMGHWGRLAHNAQRMALRAA